VITTLSPLHKNVFAYERTGVAGAEGVEPDETVIKVFSELAELPQKLELAVQ
jgi:hypothetical protein